MTISMKLFANTCQLSLIFHSLQIIFIHYKSRIATAIRGLLWMKMTMVNSGLKGLTDQCDHVKQFRKSLECNEQVK